MNADPQVVAAILRSDLYSFIQAIFPLVSPGDPFAGNWHIEAIAYQLSRVLKGEVKRLIITVPPRSLKSICASVAFPKQGVAIPLLVSFTCRLRAGILRLHGIVNDDQV